jgi:hypothetical protein
VTDLVAEYLGLALSGARPDDPRLVLLLDAMTPAEVQRAKEAIGAELLRREQIPERPN